MGSIRGALLVYAASHHLTTKIQVLPYELRRDGDLVDDAFLPAG
jgi:hypothetical protein